MRKRITQIEIIKHILQKSAYATVSLARMVELVVNLPGGMNVTVKLEQPESTVRQVGEICVHQCHVHVQYIHLDSFSTLDTHFIKRFSLKHFNHFPTGYRQFNKNNVIKVLPPAAAEA